MVKFRGEVHPVTASIPAGPAEVTSDWLSAVLSGEDSYVAIRDVEVTPVGTGQTGATYRAAVSHSQRPPGLPDSFIVKLPSQDRTVTGWACYRCR